MLIHDWLAKTFAGPEAKTILEFGAYDGADTAKLAALPGATVYAFEPDPRNKPPALPNVFLERLAIGRHTGTTDFYLSLNWATKPWTCSSSIRKPKNHHRIFPDVEFAVRPIKVGIITLDDFCQKRGIERIDVIWADIQGAEGDMIAGGHTTLAKTRFLYVETSDGELYEGQPKLAHVRKMLPEYEIIEMFPGLGCVDVLFANKEFK